MLRLLIGCSSGTEVRPRRRKVRGVSLEGTEVGSYQPLPDRVTFR